MSKNLSPQEKFEKINRILSYKLDGKGSIEEGCKIEGISRASYFRWKAQYSQNLGTGLICSSRRPNNSPNRTSKQVRDLIYKLAKSGKYTSARKIHLFLETKKIAVSENTVLKILKQKGCYNKMVIQKKNQKPYITRVYCI